VIDKLTLITGNEGKAREYAAMLGIEVLPVEIPLLEIQSLDPVEVVQTKVADAYAKLGSPVLVDDTGLRIAEWNGLPGALVSWFLQSVGPRGILTMASGIRDRRATVTTALGYADADGIQVFTGSLEGTLTTEIRGSGGFGYDSIFLPDGGDKTFAEMTGAEKNEVSHRRRAVEAMQVGLALIAN